MLWGAEYDGQGRAYVDPTDGNARFPSVTSIFKHTPKSDLISWATMKVAEKARDRTDIVMGDPDKVVDRLRYAHNEYRDERAEVGTNVHATIQAEAEDAWDFPELNEEEEAIVEQFHDFCETYQVEILVSEFTVKVPCGVMGTGDAIIRYVDPFTGESRVAMLDWKTSRRIWEEHKLQLSALANAEYMLREVEEGAPGAFLRKGKVKAENSWWVRAPIPKFDTVAVVQLRADYWEFEEIDIASIPTYYRKYEALVAVDAASRAIKEMEK